MITIMPVFSTNNFINAGGTRDGAATTSFVVNGSRPRSTASTEAKKLFKSILSAIPGISINRIHQTSKRIV